jgi:hypothetical protein
MNPPARIWPGIHSRSYQGDPGSRITNRALGGHWQGQEAQWAQRQFQSFRIRQILVRRWEYNIQYITCIDAENACVSVRRERLFGVLAEFDLPTNWIARLVKMCSNDTYSKFHIDQHVCETFPIHRGPKRDALSPILSTTV